ncbi:MAG: anion permease, partial [Candidatus Marinimicrobia bacterium]|nr:anion permease [Candidatus Neomarinimicrobiota bacterium]
VYNAVEWPVVLLLAAFVPIGMAMHTTGAADILATAILWIAGLFSDGLNPHVVLAVLYLCTSLMTGMVSNNATAIILAPIALSIATHLGVDPRPFLVAVAFASSAAFMTPISYQTNMMVYGPGSYRFTDYTRFGVAMNLGLWLLAVMLIPKIWPL